MPGVRDRVAVVTGAAAGLGREIAQLLAREGAPVVIGDVEPVGLALIGVVVFTVYTAYDVKRIGYGDYLTATGSIEKASVLGAVHLYINFINIFLFLLRLLGSRD